MDDIQQKLALIDAQITGRADLLKRIIATAPLLFPAVGLITGIVIQDFLFAPRAASHGPRLLWFWLPILALSAAVAAWTFAAQLRGRLNNYAPVLLASCALICFVSLGAIRLSSFHQPEPSDIRNLVADERKLATIRGRIVTDPHVNRNRQWEFARFQFTDPTSSFYLRISEVETAAGWANATGTVRVQVDEPVLDLKTGDYIQAYCWLDAFRPPTNPGQFDVAQYLARKNVFIAASVKLRESIELLETGDTGIFTKVKRKVREKAADALLSDLSPQDQTQGLLEALLLGYRANIGSDTYRAFHKTGLLHFISLSGMHLGILIGTVWWLCKLIGLIKRARAAVCIIAIAIFLLIVPPRAPTVRAAIIGWVFCISLFFRRRPNSLNTLSLAATILLLIRPTQLFEAGWQLSFASVLGILLFCHRTHFFLYEKITGLSWYQKAPKTKPFFRIISKPASYLSALFSTGLTAWLGGAGILLYHFHTINPLTSIWTVVVFLPVAGILTVGFLKMILAFLLPTAASALGVLVTGLAYLLIRMVSLLAQLDFSQMLIGHAPPAPIILYYCLVLFAGFASFRRPPIKKAICTAMALAIIVLLGVTKWQRTHRDNLIMTCLDVGHGQAIMLQLPGKANVLFDAGSVNKHDIGRRIVAPFLDYSGIPKIDAIIISHNDLDHINGIPEIVKHCKVKAVFANDAFFSRIDRWGTAKFLNERLLEKGRKARTLNEELKVGDTAIKMLWPTEQMARNQSLSDNDKSLVSFIQFAGVGILLCSDIEQFAQTQLLGLFPRLRADVVIVPHHGSAKTLEPAFLKNLKPEILICSCGRREYEKNQTADLKNAAKPFYTARDGALTISISTDGTIKINTVAPPRQKH
ncbi:MAG: DNA internalization-related competence protein ComEC/Rec2 [Planctomycetota bacterium]|jgi:competence protein ComEC